MKLKLVETNTKKKILDEIIRSTVKTSLHERLLRKNVVNVKVLKCRVLYLVLKRKLYEV